MYFRRVLAGTVIVGAMGLALSCLGAGIAGAEPDRGPARDTSGQPLPVSDQPTGEQRKTNSAAPSNAPAPSTDIADEIVRNLSQLPPPDLSSLAPQVNVPVSVGLPGIGLGLVPNLNVPIVLGGIGTPSLPSLPDLSKLPPPPQLPGIGLPQLPGIGLPSF